MNDMDQATDTVAYLRPMMRVHVAALWCVAAGFLFPPIFAAAAVLALITAVLMTMAAQREAGTGYAIRYLLLLVVLTPVALIGPIGVPFLVWSDLTKRRIATKCNDNRSGSVNEPGPAHRALVEADR